MKDYIFVTYSAVFLETPNSLPQHKTAALRNGRSSDLPPGFTERLPDQSAVACVSCPQKGGSQQRDCPGFPPVFPFNRLLL